MNLVTYFTDDEVRNIYNCVLEYSMRKYEDRMEILEPIFGDRYNHAKNLVGSRLKMSNPQLEEYLTEKKQKYDDNKLINEFTVNSSAEIIEEFFVKYSKNCLNDIDKANYLFDFASGILTYSDDWYEYCHLSPPVGDFEFDFKKNLPVEQNINGLLAIGQGICDDFCNLVQYLGNKIGLDINKIIVTYGDNRHSLNTINIDGVTSLIDITRFIRHDMNKDECFLTSEKDLLKFELYKFDEDTSTESFPPEKKVSNVKVVDELIELTKSIRPKVKYIKEEKKVGYQK